MTGIADLIGLSQATLGNIWQNIAIALGLKAVFLVTTLFGITTLWMAILADTGATVLVTANALRLLTLGEAALRALDAGQISAGHARAILAQPEKDRAWALEQITTRQLNVREAEGLKREAKAGVPIKVNPPRTYRQLELDLSRRTGTKVRITGEDKGRVELNYASREELDRILELLGYAAEE